MFKKCIKRRPFVIGKLQNPKNRFFKEGFKRRQIKPFHSAFSLSSISSCFHENRWGKRDKDSRELYANKGLCCSCVLPNQQNSRQTLCTKFADLERVGRTRDTAHPCEFFPACARSFFTAKKSALLFPRLLLQRLLITLQQLHKKSDEKHPVFSTKLCTLYD